MNNGQWTMDNKICKGTKKLLCYFFTHQKLRNEFTIVR